MEPLPIDLTPSAELVVEPAPATTGGPGNPAGNTVSGGGWRRRLAAALIDGVVFVPAAVSLTFNIPLALLLLVAAGAFTVWQLRVLQRRTGQTIGKNRVGIFVVPATGVVRDGARRSRPAPGPGSRPGPTQPTHTYHRR